MTPDTNYDAEPASVESTIAGLQQLRSFKVQFNGQDLEWKWSNVPRALSERRNLYIIGTAAAASAVIVGAIAYPPRRGVLVAAGDSATSTALMASVSRTPFRRGAIAAGLAAVGTGALCTWAMD